MFGSSRTCATRTNTPIRGDWTEQFGPSHLRPKVPLSQRITGKPDSNQGESIVIRPYIHPRNYQLHPSGSYSVENRTTLKHPNPRFSHRTKPSLASPHIPPRARTSFKSANVPRSFDHRRQIQVEQPPWSSHSDRSHHSHPGFFNSSRLHRHPAARSPTAPTATTPALYVRSSASDVRHPHVPDVGQPSSASPPSRSPTRHQ